jgi:hypothetical protein
MKEIQNKVQKSGSVMIREMANIAIECVKVPRRKPVRCHEPMSQATIRQEIITRQFRLVFLTAAGGTFLFVLLCLVCSLIAGKEPPPLVDKVIMGFFDLAKIGFGTIVGLLGGKTLETEHRRSRS